MYLLFVFSIPTMAHPVMPPSNMELGCDFLINGAWPYPVLGHGKSMRPRPLGIAADSTEQKLRRGRVVILTSSLLR